jgi:hypothetical protein
VIVFTEYRDTLLHVADGLGGLAVVLHGGLSRQERSTALSAFVGGERRVLLATDVAGEGLNLQRACRTVINLELPWNPMRLEQRVGRVDRIGQTRTVHAFHLVAAGTGEERLLATLRDKITRARRDIGAPDPLGHSFTVATDDARLAMVVGGVVRQLPAPSTREEAEPEAVSTFREDAVLESQRVAEERTFAAGVTCAGPARTLASSATGPLVTRPRNAHTRRSLGLRVLLIWEIAAEDEAGRLVASEPVAITIALHRAFGRRMDRPAIDRVVEACCREARPLVERAGTTVIERATIASAAFWSARLAREHAIGGALAPPAFQPGLFDRRADHAHAVARAARQELADMTAKRVATLEQRARIAPLRRVLRLVLLP